jgi:hypothetical protein
MFLGGYVEDAAGNLGGDPRRANGFEDAVEFDNFATRCRADDRGLDFEGGGEGLARASVFA